MRTKIQTAVLILAASLLLFTSCKKDQVAPALPPLNTFVLQTADFDSTKANSTKSTLVTYNNFLHSVGSIIVGNIVLYANLVVPVASYVEAFKHEGVYQSDGSWVWSYNVWAENAIYTAKLRAYENGDEINWEMKISRSGLGGFTDFKWYDGISKKDGSSGVWNIYQKNWLNHANEGKALNIDWVKDSKIKYERTLGVDAGAYIEYGNSVGDFDRYYNINYQSNLMEIQWNTINKNGRVKNPKTYLDEMWHCWNNLVQDVACE